MLRVLLENDVKIETWQPSNWRKLPIKQGVPFAEAELAEVCAFLARLASEKPLLSRRAVQRTETSFAKVAREGHFIFHIGDCAERLIDANVHHVATTLMQWCQIKSLVEKTTQRKVLVLGRMAGQYAKPRSHESEFDESKKIWIPSFRGDNVHDFYERTPQPARLLAGFKAAKKIIAILKAYKAPLVGVSHEALILPYEEAMTRKIGDEYYNVGAHLLWVGERTRDIGFGHLEYLRGIANPVGVKLGPSASEYDILEIVRLLNPENKPGRLTLIPRLGSGEIARKLPAWLEIAKKHALEVLWILDPCHGNTRQGRRKTRFVSDILSELALGFEVFSAFKMPLSGVHLETSAYHVTECVGENVREEDLDHAYQTFCDPRLNPTQMIRVVEEVASWLRRLRRPTSHIEKENIHADLSR